MCNMNDADKKNQQNAGPNNAKNGMNEPERGRESQGSEKEKADNQSLSQSNQRQGDSCAGPDCM